MRDDDNDLADRRVIDREDTEARSFVPVTYHYKAVSDAERDRAARTAVLLPLLGTDSIVGNTKALQHASIKASLDRLRVKWCKRVDALLRADCRQVETRADIMRNCPPFGCTTSNPPVFRCKCPRLCPFCYARDYVYKAFDTLDEVLFGDAEAQQARRQAHEVVQPNPKFSLFEFTASYSWPFERTARSDITADLRSAQIRQYVLPAIIVARNEEVDALRKGRLLSSTFQRIELRNDCTVLFRSGLAVVDRMPPQYLISRAHLKHTMHRRIDRRTLSAAVGRLFRYPRTLFTTSAHETVALLGALGKTRMYAHANPHNLKNGFAIL